MGGNRSRGNHSNDIDLRLEVDYDPLLCYLKRNDANELKMWVVSDRSDEWGEG
jgi:hypothetical protein